MNPYCFCALTIALLPWNAIQAQAPQVELQIERSVAFEGSEEFDWYQVRAAFDPTRKAYTMTASQTAKTGAHGFHDVYESISTDGGQTWSTPAVIPSLKRTLQDDGYEVVAGDLTPVYHVKTDTILNTGKTFNFEGSTKENILREKVSYAVKNLETGTWSPLQIMAMPEKDHSGAPIIAPNAGCHQRVDLPNGDILLPVRYQRSEKPRNYTTVVVRCSFDGETLTYLEHGSEHNIPTKRGLYEPSVTEFQGRFFLTMRADDGAWVSSGKDGIHYDEVQEWRFDDGELLGSYNTQQHWVTIGNALFLVYTRKGANNDHIMRHRAPLFIGQVNPETLQVIRSTEQILLPENDALLGNSGVTQVGPNEVLVTCGEGGVWRGARKGENNQVLLARITVK